MAVLMALLFASQVDAQTAITTINAGMGLGPGDGDVTVTWDVPKQDTNGKWVVTKPEARFMAGVVGYIDDAYYAKVLLSLDRQTGIAALG